MFTSKAFAKQQQNLPMDEFGDQTYTWKLFLGDRVEAFVVPETVSGGCSCAVKGEAWGWDQLSQEIDTTAINRPHTTSPS